MKYLLLLLISLNVFAIGSSDTTMQIDVLHSKQISTPSNPSAGKNKLYFKNDNILYSLTSAGTESAIGITPPVSSVFGRTGAVTAQSGDYTSAQITELTNLFFTNARGIGAVLTAFTSGAGTVTSSDTVLSAIQKLDGNIALKQDALANVVSSGSCTNCNVTFNAKGIATAYSNGSGGGGGGLTSSTTSSAAFTASVNTSYILTNSTSRQAITLPSSATVGDRIELIGQANGKWDIYSNSSASAQKIRLNNNTSNISSASAIQLFQAEQIYSTAELVYTLSDTWTVVDYVSGSLIADTNYWGDGGDGSVTISVDTSLTSTTDGDCVVKNYQDLTIDSSVTLTTSTRTRCLVIYAKGNAVINGALSMTGRGAAVDPSATSSSDGHAVTSNGIVIRRFKSGAGAVTNTATDRVWGSGNAFVNAEANQASLVSQNGIVVTVQKVGTGGPAAVSCSGFNDNKNGNSGGAGSAGQSGSGGGGGCGHDDPTGTATAGAGSAGTCWSGGSGGGGAMAVNSSITAGSGAAFGGAGGNGDVNGGNYSAALGGTGNNGGASTNGQPNGTNGTGGTLFLFVRGNLTIGASGSIQANGVQASQPSSLMYHGGSSGGGNVVVMHGGTLSNAGSITANGGATSGASAVAWQARGGAGGPGSVQGPTQIDL